MKYSVQIDKSVAALAHCLSWFNNDVVNSSDWNININAGGIDYGIYLNVDVANNQIEICNQPRYTEELGLSDIIEIINSN